MTDLTTWREQQREARRGHHGINAWHCPVCGKNTVAIDVDPGVTPMFLACRRTPGCQGPAVSSGYPAAPPPAHILAHLEWEWALPTEAEYSALDAAARAHVDAGGLILKPRGTRPSAYAFGAIGGAS